MQTKIQPNIGIQVNLSFQFFMKIQCFLRIVDTKIAATAQLENATKFMKDKIGSIPIGFLYWLRNVYSGINSTFKVKSISCSSIDMSQICVGKGCHMFLCMKGQISGIF